MRKHKIHKRSVRMANNTGIDFPVCQRTHRLLNLDACRWPTTANDTHVTCKNCLTLIKSAGYDGRFL